MMPFLRGRYESAGVWVELAQLDLCILARSSAAEAAAALVGEDRDQLVCDLVKQGRQRGRGGIWMRAHLVCFILVAFVLNRAKSNERRFRNTTRRVGMTSCLDSIFVCNRFPSPGSGREIRG